MKRVYSTYTNEQLKMLEAEAKQRNMSVSAYQRYLVLLALPQIEPVVHDLEQLSADMFITLNEIEKDQSKESYNPFIVSSLFSSDTWSELSPSEKRTLAMKLSHYVRKNKKFEKIGVLSGKISQYKKI